MTYENYDNIANVLDYGAKPYLNGESSEGDSTAAFMDAINTGKPVYVPNAVGYPLHTMWHYQRYQMVLNSLDTLQIQAHH